MSLRSATFGTTLVLINAFVSGERHLPFLVAAVANHFSISARSYVWPSSVITGSVMSSDEMGHKYSCGGVFDRRLRLGEAPCAGIGFDARMSILAMAPFSISTIWSIVCRMSRWVCEHVCGQQGGRPTHLQYGSVRPTAGHSGDFFQGGVSDNHHLAEQFGPQRFELIRVAFVALAPRGQLQWVCPGGTFQILGCIPVVQNVLALSVDIAN
jgi:hypothetical protein